MTARHTMPLCHVPAGGNTAVLRYVMGFKANIAIVFLGAFAVMALIKLTTYLPGKYYFSFSKLFAGASEPFIVDLPSFAR